MHSIKSLAFVIRASSVVLSTIAILALFIQFSMAQTFTFNDFVIEGNKRIETATILSFAGIEKGQTLSASEVDAAVQRIRDSNLFNNVSTDIRGDILVIMVEEFPTVNLVVFEGNSSINDGVLTNFVRSKSRQIFDQNIVTEDADSIAQAYADQGRISAVVVPRIIKRSDNRVDVIYEITEGGIIEIERVSFVGNSVFTDSNLRRVIESKQAGRLRLFVSNDIFVEDRIELDKQRLRDFYNANGYIDFEVKDVRAELTRERDGFLVTFTLVEGPQFRVGDVNIISEIPSVSEDGFLPFLRVAKGDIFTEEAVDESIAELGVYAAEQGFSFVRVDPRVSRNDVAQALDIDFILSPDNKVFVERIDISGNRTTADRVIRRQFDFVEGDPFNQRKMRRSLDRIRALGFFANVNINAREGSSPSQVVIEVEVQERSTGKFGFGANYSTKDGASFALNLSESNFLGRGQRLAFDLNVGEKNTSFSFDFIEPSILDRDVALGINTRYGTQSVKNAYKINTVRFSPSLTFSTGKNSRLNTSAIIKSDTITSATSATSTASGVINNEIEEPNRTDLGLGYSYSYDTRRDDFDYGIDRYYTVSQDFVNGSGNLFIKSTLSSGLVGYIYGDEIELSAEFDAGVLTFLNGHSRVTDRFLSTPRTLRGFKFGGIGPRQNKVALGGDYYAIVRLESKFPLGFAEDYGISGGAFFDAGSLWGLNSADTEGQTDITSNEFKLRSVVGLSLFWATPIGPLRFNFSQALSKEDLDDVQNFELTIETRF